MFTRRCVQISYLRRNARRTMLAASEREAKRDRTLGLTVSFKQSVV